MPEAALRYLETLQRHQAESGRFPRSYFRNAPFDAQRLTEFAAATVPADAPDRDTRINRIVAKQLRELDELTSQLPTPLQNVITFSILKDILSELEGTADRLGIRRMTAAEPVYGTLASGRVNGMAVRPPGSSTALILFEDGLWIFCHLMAKAIAQVFPVVDGTGSGHHFSTAQKDWDLALDSPSITRMKECLSAYVIRGDATTAPSYLASASANALAGVFLHGAELYVVGHEWAHVHRGHLEAGGIVEAQLPEGSVLAIANPHALELEADFYGAVLSVQAQIVRGLDLALSYLGPRFLLTCMEIVEQLVSLLFHGEVTERPTSLSHPPTRLRREAMDEALSDSFVGHFPAEQIENAVSAAQTIDAVLERARDELVAHFRTLYEDGELPHSIWTR